MSDAVGCSVSGEPAEARAFDGGTLQALTSTALAPGQRTEVCVVLSDRSVTAAAKSLGSRRRDDGRFEVRLRLLSLRREDRDALAAALRR